MNYTVDKMSQIIVELNDSISAIDKSIASAYTANGLLDEIDHTENLDNIIESLKNTREILSERLDKLESDYDAYNSIDDYIIFKNKLNTKISY